MDVESSEAREQRASQLLAQLGLDATVALPPRSTVTPELLEKAQTLRLDGGGVPASLPPVGVSTLPQLGVALPDGAPGDLVGPESELVVQGAIGAGGMGAVYVAEQRSLGREVALKTLRARSPEAERALVLEGTITGKLEHPGIPPIHSLGRALDGRPVLVMKRIVGVTWVELLDDDQHPAWASLRMLPSSHFDAHLRILAQVAEAVEFAHARAFLHRDVKPENVMVGQHGEVYLVDWGIATKLREDRTADVLIGTPAYLAPETVTGGPLTTRTDVFLLGAALHYCLVRKPKHEGTSLQGILASAARCAPYAYPPSVPAELAELANRATARDPADRPESALAFRDALEAFFERRASNAIAESAGLRLRELEGLIRDGVPDAVVAIRLASEARFGFVEALRERRDNDAARSGLERTLRATIRLELSRGNPATARALAAELTSVDDTLEAEILAVERRLERAAREQARMRLAVHDADPAVAARSQRKFAVALAVTLSLAGFTQLATYEPMPFDAPLGWRFLHMGLFDIAATLAAGAALRARIAASALSRRMFIGLLAMLVLFTAQRGFAVYRGQPMWIAIASDNFVLATGTVALGVLSHRAWLAAGAVFTAAALLVEALPAWARLFGGFAGPVAATAGALALFFDPPPSSAPPSG